VIEIRNQTFLGKPTFFVCWKLDRKHHICKQGPAVWNLPLLVSGPRWGLRYEDAPLQTPLQCLALTRTFLWPLCSKDQPRARSVWLTLALHRDPGFSNSRNSSSKQREYRGRTGAQPRFYGGKPRCSPSFGMLPQLLAVKSAHCSGLPRVRANGYARPETSVWTHAPVRASAQVPVSAWEILLLHILHVTGPRKRAHASFKGGSRPAG
jgi:hypothetical protein